MNSGEWSISKIEVLLNIRYFIQILGTRCKIRCPIKCAMVSYPVHSVIGATQTQSWLPWLRVSSSRPRSDSPIAKPHPAFGIRRCTTLVEKGTWNGVQTHLILTKSGTKQKQVKHWSTQYVVVSESKRQAASHFPGLHQSTTPGDGTQCIEVLPFWLQKSLCRKL